MAADPTGLADLLDRDGAAAPPAQSSRTRFDGPETGRVEDRDVARVVSERDRTRQWEDYAPQEPRIDSVALLKRGQFDIILAPCL